MAVYAAVMNDYRFNKSDLHVDVYLDGLEDRFYEESTPAEIIMDIKG